MWGSALVSTLALSIMASAQNGQVRWLTVGEAVS